MMKNLLLIILINSFAFSSSAFELTKKEKNYIKTLRNKDEIVRRFSSYYKFFKEAKNFSKEKKLNRVNNYVNRIIGKNDDTNEWSSPKEFLIKGRGDCEDYAFAKYFSLQELDIDTSRLYLTVVKVKGSKNFHMVLMYLNEKNIPMILDNLSWKMLPLSKRKTLKFIFAFNQKASYIFENGKLVKEKKQKIAEVKFFNEMLNKVNQQSTKKSVQERVQ